MLLVARRCREEARSARDDARVAMPPRDNARRLARRARVRERPPFVYCLLLIVIRQDRDLPPRPRSTCCL